MTSRLVEVEVLETVGLTLGPVPAVLPTGARQDLTVLGVLSDGSIERLGQGVRWVVDDPRIAEVRSDGLIAIREGETKIRAEWRTLRSLPVAVRVAAGALQQLTVGPDEVSLRPGETASLRVAARIEGRPTKTPPQRRRSIRRDRQWPRSTTTGS